MKEDNKLKLLLILITGVIILIGYLTKDKLLNNNDSSILDIQNTHY